MFAHCTLEWRQTDWNIDRHCALNLKKKKNKKKNLSFFPFKFVFVSREEEKTERFSSRFFFFFFFSCCCFGSKKRTDLWGSDEKNEWKQKGGSGWPTWGGEKVWCQTRNSRRLSSFRVEWTASGSVRACTRVCVCLCVRAVEIFGNHKTKTGRGRGNKKKTQHSPRRGSHGEASLFMNRPERQGVVRGCVASSSHLF